jgi:hypothetical protein
VLILRRVHNNNIASTGINHEVERVNSVAKRDTDAVRIDLNNEAFRPRLNSPAPSRLSLLPYRLIMLVAWQKQYELLLLYCCCRAVVKQSFLVKKVQWAALLGETQQKSLCGNGKSAASTNIEAIWICR